MEASDYKAFTLIEILAVVILLGILAAVVVPQIALSTTEAREAALRSDLKSIRTAMELYRLDHDMYPGYIRQRNGRISRWAPRRFIAQLLGTTDADGRVGPTDYGPYLPKFPANSFATNPAKAAKVRRGPPNGRGPGWAFDPDTEEFHANDPDDEHQQW